MHTLFENYEPNFLWDPSKKSCKEACNQDSISKIMNNASDAIQSSDLVYIASPPSSRDQYVLEAAKSGKAIFLEKPLGINIDASKKLLKELMNYKIPISVNFVQASGIPLTDLLETKKRGHMGELLGVDIILSYSSWPREWQKEALWLNYRAEGGMTREVISHFLFFTERVLGPLKIVWSKTSYPKDNSSCETGVLAKLESLEGCPVNILATIGGIQPDRQELTIKGSKKSRRISEFYKDYETLDGEFISLREEPLDPRALSLKSQLDDLSLKLKGLPNRLATLEEALRIQILIEGILSNSS